MSQLLTYAPVAFVVGVVVGLVLCSRWRIVRRPDRETKPDNEEKP